MLENCVGKSVSAIKAYGIDNFDFTPNLLGNDFSVGEFGYTVFEFLDTCFYISTEGISSIQPPRPNVKEIAVEERIINIFLGSTLQAAWFEDDSYFLQFDGLDLLQGRFSFERGHTGRNYFDLEFPWT